jgi:hypothetical protein
LKHAGAFDRQTKGDHAVQRLSVFVFGLVIMSTPGAYDMEQHLWQERLLILVAPSEQDPDLQRLREIVRDRRDAIVDRDLRVFELVADRGWCDGEPLDAAEVAALRARLAVSPDAKSMILVGLDGGEKRRASLNTELSDLFAQIDGMPMRRADIRAKRSAGRPVTEP